MTVLGWSLRKEQVIDGSARPMRRFHISSQTRPGFGDRPLLREPADVVRALRRFGDFVDPKTGSILFLGGTRRRGGDPFHPAFLTGVEERTELARRLQRLAPRERLLLFLWYVEGWPAARIAERLEISRVHCYRLRNRALRDTVADEAQPSAAV